MRHCRVTNLAHHVSHEPSPEVAMKLPALLATLLCAAAATLQAAPPTVRAARFTTPPIIDGRLDDACWQQAAPIGGFKVNGSGKPAANATEARIGYDDTGLVIGFVCSEADPASLVRTPAARDGNEVYRNDCVEVMLDPGRSQDKYVHFLVDANGTVFDRAVDQGGTIGNDTWSADVEAAAFVGDGFWSCELRVPFSSLGLTPKAQGEWGVNLCRNKWKPAENSAIAHNASFNKATDFLALEPLAVDLTPFTLAIGAPTAATRLREGRISVDLSIPLANPAEKDRTAVVTAAFILPDGDTVGGRREVTLPAGESQTVLLDKLVLPANGDYPLSVTVSDPRTKRSLSTHDTMVPVKYSPLEIAVVAPFYRDTIYASQKLEAVVLEFTTPLGAEELKDASLMVTIAPAGGGAAVASQAVKPVGKSSRVSFAVKTLPEGRLTIVGELKAADGTSLARVAHPLFKAPAATDEWYVDSDLVLRHNGEPFWGYGWFNGSNLEGEPLTVNFHYHLANQTVEQVREFVAGQHAKGVFSIVDYCPKELYRVNYSKELTPAEEQLLRERIRGLRSMPGLLGYYMEDEPDGHSGLPRRYERGREILMEEDPYHPCFQLVADASYAAKYMSGCDIMMVDPYFRPLRSGPPAMPISLMTASLATASSAAKGRNPVWVLPQAFSFWDMYADAREPNFIELRNQWLQAVIGGARGVMWFVGGTRLYDVETDLAGQFLAFEDAALRPALTAAVVADALAVAAPVAKELRAAFRQVGDRFYVFAVNTAREPQQGVRLTLANGYTGELWVVSEGRKVTAEKGVIADDFATYAGHIYTTDPALADRETLAQVEARIAGEKNKRINPDNLAQGPGVTVKAPSGYGPDGWYPHFPPTVLVDGGHKAWVGGPLHTGNAPKRIELRFPQPVTAGRVLVQSTPGKCNLAKYELEVQAADGAWKKVAAGVNAAADAPLEIGFPPESIQAVALDTYSAIGGGNLSLTEIEVFAP